jgi:hypothetical protein
MRQGNPKAIVFPDPVAAIPTMSRPDRAMGRHWDWMGDGNANFRVACSITSGRPAIFDQPWTRLNQSDWIDSICGYSGCGLRAAFPRGDMTCDFRSTMNKIVPKLLEVLRMYWESQNAKVLWGCNYSLDGENDVYAFRAAGSGTWVKTCELCLIGLIIRSIGPSRWNTCRSDSAGLLGVVDLEVGSLWFVCVWGGGGGKGVAPTNPGEFLDCPW